jgi:hypothetical protein
VLAPGGDERGVLLRSASVERDLVGDLIISRHNNARIPLDAAPGLDREPDQVRNDNRWRVAGIVAAHRVIASIVTLGVAAGRSD